ncbi:hypothetical protein GQ44DRAFT_612616, partial [Phaeosphaeriaceae sp. PMI808]
ILESSLLYIVVSSGLKFDCTRVLFTHNGETFCGKLPFKLSDRGMDLEKLEDVKHIPSDSCRPLYKSTFTIAPSLDHCFVKKPRLRASECNKDRATQVLQELTTCEITRNALHRNLAIYHGCKVLDGRIDGLIFKEYRTNLMEWFNPNKSTFVRAQGRAIARHEAARQLPDLEDAIHHLHSLGRVHNDITPRNITLYESRLVITDFDSSRAPGEALYQIKRTYGWYNPNVHVPQAENGLDTLKELSIWLTSSLPTEFQFGG